MRQHLLSFSVFCENYSRIILLIFPHYTISSIISASFSVIPAKAGIQTKKFNKKRRFAYGDRGSSQQQQRKKIINSDNRVIVIFSSPHFDSVSCFDLFKEKVRGPV
jgi:hypothetical protein